MKKQTQKTAAASPKARRKSETLTLDREAAFLLQRVEARLRQEDDSFYTGTASKPPTQSDSDRARARRFTGNRLLSMVCEAMLQKEGSLRHGWAWWKCNLVQMSQEEIEAEKAMTNARYETIGGSLEPIDDATEAAAIQKLQADKSAAALQPAPREAAPGIAPAVRCVGCIEGEDEKAKVLFGLDMLPHGWQRIQEMLAESPEVKVVFRIERGEKQPFTGWQFVTAPEAHETDDED